MRVHSSMALRFLSVEVGRDSGVQILHDGRYSHWRGRYGSLLPAQPRQYAVHLPLWQSPPSRKGTRFQVKTAAPVNPAPAGPAQTLHS